MAIPTITELLLPNFNWTTVVGVLLIALSLFGGTFLQSLSAGLSFITRSKISHGMLVTIFIGIGIILIWGVSIVEDVLNSNELLLIIAGIIFFIAIVIIGGKRNAQ